ncbi:substrate-binding domain-containing protein [Halalkalibacter alkaliphilus]|uniref:histidine kinase n=1 Tax=Halalkalibacter alkaliphilus TaxID=2917993 RepID=A0A9X2CUT3_9BACI|nr:substrate-binding domain-containing protein [Halalkalibacter alkaliphilus]MCL7748606.1 substrate-binding domain-containing protein [Halalkalibacter alkaliphilus]
MSDSISNTPLSVTERGLVCRFTKRKSTFIFTYCDGFLLYNWGFNQEDVNGKKLEDIFPSELSRIINKYCYQAWNGQFIQYETKLKGNDYIAFFAPLFNNGEIVEVIGTFIQSNKSSLENEQVNTNSLYEDVLQTMSEAVIIIEKDGKVTALNENFQKMIGLKGDYTYGWTEVEYVAEDGSHLPYSELPGVKTLEKGISFHNSIVGVKDNENNQIKWLSVNSKPLTIRDHSDRASLVSISDITERKEMENTYIQAKEEAEKANRAKSDFLSKMSHELRTPLNGIFGFAQLLELDDSLNDQQRDYVQEILKGGGHLLNLINEVLDLSRIETGKLKVSIEEVPLLNIIDECTNIVEPLAKKKNIRIQKQLDPQHDMVVLADPVRLKQILLNLLENAIKYNRQNGNIMINSYLEGDDQFVHIVDTGVGFSVEEYHKIFVPFYRVEGTKEEGTGIGLAIVKQLVQQMGGEISVRSKKGQGSEFCFRLPIPKNLKPVIRWEDEVESIKKVEGRSEHYRLLYIEDNESNLNLVKNIIKSHPSYTLLTANNGKEGIKKAALEKIDLILLDLNLPDMNGYAVFDMLKAKEQTKGIAVIAVSANAMPQDIQHTLNKGFDNYLSKPIHVKEFLNTVSETLNNTITQNIPHHTILSTGPYGEEAVSAKTLQLSLTELKKIKEKKYRAAIAMHYADNDWSKSQIAGVTSTFEKMGIEVIAVTDAQFKWEKQVEDIETILIQKPDIIVSIPVDPIFTASVYKKAANAGVKLVFMDNVPKGLEHGKDYVSIVSADNFGNGIEAAHIMGQELGGKGKVGMINYNADFFATKQRTEGFEETIKQQYPSIELVAQEGLTDPSHGEKVAVNMIRKNPDMNGMFVVWDVPAEGAMKAAEAVGKSDLVITTIDLGFNAALEMAKDRSIKGLGAQLPYQQGVAEAILAGYALLRKQTPPYVAVPALRVTKENLLEAWRLVYNEDAPNLIQRTLK